MRLIPALKRRTLARDLAIGLTIAVSVVLFLVSVVVYTLLVNEADARLKDRVVEKADRLVDVLAPRLWNLDYDSVERIGNAYADSSDIAFIQLHEPGGEQFVFAAEDADVHAYDYVMEREVVYHDESVGTLAIYVTRSSIHTLRLGIFLSSLLAAFVSVTTILFVTHFLFRRFLQRPIVRVQRGLAQLSAGNYAYRIAPAGQEDVNEIVDGINGMAEQIQKREAELRDSEQKYRFLVEDSGDLIFSLDSHGQIVTMNQAVRRLLGRPVKSVVGELFVDLLYRAGNIRDLVRVEQAMKAIRRLESGEKSTSLSLELGTTQNEPREMLIQLERVDTDRGDVMILGKAMLPAENLLGKHTERETRKFVIGNYISVADLILNAITVNLTRYCPEDLATEMKMGVKEMLTNAIEHGNLAITFDEKHKATTEETYYDLIKKRQKHPEYRKRTVMIYYSLRPERVMFVIRDQGAGFDHQAALKRGEVESERFHGRGILVTRHMFDVVRYNERGNQVTLVKYFAPRRGVGAGSRETAA
ncbi:MAG: ATP-binding protein [Spirochaetales bacterium]|nr:ATP-binding protein [Leptospiraceae bacterium]MCP5481380.1 ATP-binding protein [Spirochaetales bacterium]MCP5486074.1 ATP-binding protein [Spirochaetales bacterium]